MPGVQDLYRAQILRSRAQFLRSLPDLKGKAVAELNGLAGKLDGFIAAQAKTGLIPPGSLRTIGNQINTLVPATTKGIESLLDNQIKVSIETAAIGKQKGAKVFSSLVKAAGKEKGILKIPEVNVAFGGGMQNFTEELIKQVWDKRWADGRKLSQRIWNFNKITEKDLLRKVKAGIGEGKSARNISKGLRQYLTKDGKGSPVYRSMRLARTETNEAYKLAHEEIAKKETFVKGTKWNLSGSHKKVDECDDLAAGGPQGSGVYPVAEYPSTPHPQCLCFPTDETPTTEEFLNRQREVPGHGWVDKGELPDKEYADYLSKASAEIKPVGFDKIGKMGDLVPHRPIGKVTGIAADGPITGDMAVELTRKNFMRKLGFSKGRFAIEKGLDSWNQAVHLPKSCWLRGGINKSCGLPWQKGLDSAQVKAVTNLIAEGQMPALDSKTVGAIKAYKAYTHALLKNTKVESLTVWRGVARDQAEEIAKAALTNDMVKVKLHSFSSFTDIKGMAIDFANQKFVGGPSVPHILDKGIVFKTSVKAQNVFICEAAGGNQWVQGEIYVVAAKESMLISKNNIEIGGFLLGRI